MAKKKAKAMKKEMPAKKQKSSSMGWIIAAIVVIVIIAYLVMRSGTQAPTTQQQAPSTSTTKGSTLTSAEAPTFNSKCTVPLGVVPGTQKVDNGVLSVTFKNNGKGSIDGTYFEFSDAKGDKRYKKNSDAIAAGETITYTVDLNQVGTELGAAVKTFVMYPVESGNACLNQRVVVIQ